VIVDSNYNIKGSGSGILKRLFEGLSGRTEKNHGEPVRIVAEIDRIFVRYDAM